MCFFVRPQNLSCSSVHWRPIEVCKQTDGFMVRAGEENSKKIKHGQIGVHVVWYNDKYRIGISCFRNPLRQEQLPFQTGRLWDSPKAC